MGVVISACQTTQSRCCSLVDGLLQPSDLHGSWEQLSDAMREIVRGTTSIPNDEQVSATETAEQYLTGHLASSDQSIYVIHQLRRFQSVAPLLTDKPAHPFFETKDGEPFKLDVGPVGQSSQAWCQIARDGSTNTNRMAVCVAKVRYPHLVSVTVFLFDEPASDADMTTLINKVLSVSDQRLQTIDQHLNDSSS